MERETGRHLTWSVNQFFYQELSNCTCTSDLLWALNPPLLICIFTSHHFSAWYCINIVRRISLLVSDSLLNIPLLLICFERTLILKKVSVFDEDEVYFWSNQSMYLFYFQSRMEEIKTALDKKDCKVTIME